MHQHVFPAAAGTGIRALVHASGDGDATPSLGAPRTLAIAAGEDHACALMTDRALRCWGSNVEGQLADGTLHQRSTPVRVAGLGAVAEVGFGTRFTCALCTDCAVFRQLQRRGQLGDGTRARRMTPAALPGLTGVT